MSFLKGKKILITGLASNRSIAYGIAEAMHKQGAELAFTYQNDKLKERVEKMAAEFNSKLCFPLDVTQDSQIENLFTQLSNHWQVFDGIVHSIAYAPADQLEGDYLEKVTREGFAVSHDISSYSLAALCKASKPFLNKNAAIVSLTYLGAEKVMPNYNVMGVAKASLEANIRYIADSLGAIGIRINGISAGPIKTLAAAGIRDFRRMLDYNQHVAALRDNVTIEQVGNVAAFLCSDLASGVTGEIVHVDAGFSIMGGRF